MSSPAAQRAGWAREGLGRESDPTARARWTTVLGSSLDPWAEGELESLLRSPQESDQVRREAGAGLVLVHPELASRCAEDASIPHEIREGLVASRRKTEPR